MNERVRILLVDDHSLFREGLARLLASETDFAVVGQCSSVDEGLSLLSLHTVDIVLLDYDLGNEVGTDLLESIAVLKSPPRVLLVTAGMSHLSAREALKSGAVGIIPKHSGPEHLISAIREVALSGGSLDTESQITAIAPPVDYSRLSAQLSKPLTRRQQTALNGVVNGLSNRAIGEMMHISEGSVKAIIQELFEKSGVRTRAQLVRLAMESQYESPRGS